MRGQQVVGGENVGQVVFTRHALLRLDIAFVPAQIEGQTHTTQSGDAAGTRQVALLAAAPAVNEEHARHLAWWGQQGAGDVLIFHQNVDALAAGTHKGPTLTYLASGPSSLSWP